MALIAVVTGGNKGIGFEICRRLIRNGHHVVLTSRDAVRGTEAVNTLLDQERSISPSLEMRVLDIDSPASIEQFAARMKQDFGRIDILVNNAAIAFKSSDPTPFAQQARPTISTNFFATRGITEAALPLLLASPHPRLIFVASMAGFCLPLPLFQRFSDPILSSDALGRYLTDYINAVEASNAPLPDWPATNYGISKASVIAYAKIIARDYPHIVVASCCPGYCDTDMTSHKGPRSAFDGADTPVWLVTAEGVTSGAYYSDRCMKPWTAKSL